MSSRGCTGVGGAQSPLYEVQCGLALLSPGLWWGVWSYPAVGRELCTNPGFREAARTRAAVPQLWEQKLKVAFCMTEESPLFSWLAVNAVFLSSLGLFPRERWDHKPH